jgi:Domain of unknown function (DUF3291)
MAIAQITSLPTPPGYQLAQMNIARLRAPQGDPQVAPFFAALNAVNKLAEESPGFCWRWQDNTGNATQLKLYEDPLIIVNISQWRDLASLFAFTYQSQHRLPMRQRHEWFTPHPGPHLVLWWQPDAQWPAPQEAKARLDYLTAHGPSPYAFTFKAPYSLPADAQPALA